jgi:outer membrane protein, heavy metal efflux system
MAHSSGIGQFAAVAAALLVAGCALWVGCARPSPGPESMRPVLEPRGVPEQAWQKRPKAEQVDERTDDLLSRPLEASDAVGVALLNHPRLQADLQQLRATRARAFQEALLDNPEVDAKLLLGEHTKLESEASFELGAVLQTSLRRDIARGQTEGARLQAARGVIDLLHRVRLAYYSHVADRQRLGLERHIFEAAEASAEAARLLREAGNITEFELVTQQGFASEMRLAVIRAEAAAAESRQTLHEAMGLGPAQDQWEVAERLPDPPEEAPDVDDLAERAVANNMGLARLQQEVEVQQSRVSLTRWQGWMPHLKLGVATEYEEERWLVGPALGFGLPLFDRRQYAVDALEADALGASHRRRALRGRVRARARALAKRLEASHGAARHIAESVLPLRERAVDEALRQFNAMEISVFELLQVRRTHMQAGRDYVEALRAYWHNRARTTQILAGGAVDVDSAPAQGDDSGAQAPDAPH